MIESIAGRLAGAGDDWVVVDLGAVCLRVNTTRTTLANAGAEGGAVRLFTHLYLRDDLVALYGFGTLEEREVFERLISVTGVGPRAAQALLSSLTFTSLVSAIDDGDVDVLVRAPGIGRKTAQRVILELKGRLAPESDGARPATVQANRDLIPVLMGLGYSAAEASEALQNVTTEEASSDEDRLRAALRHFSTP